MLGYSVVLIVGAFLFYTIGVWAEKFEGKLKKWHLIFFWVGFCFDTAGTTLMSIISRGLKVNIHGITGIIAILLMAFHAIWATIVLVKNDKKLIQNFHIFSIFVWLMWLIPFFTGMFINMR